jgi:hypothetical protein
MWKESYCLVVDLLFLFIYHNLKFSTTSRPSVPLKKLENKHFTWNMTNLGGRQSIHWVYLRMQWMDAFTGILSLCLVLLSNYF